MPSHEQYIEWCEASALIFQRCSRRAYFSAVISRSGRVLGTGYNGNPAGMLNCIDGGCPRAISAVAHGSSYSDATGYCAAVHAEANALLHSDRSAREGGTLYVNGPPCLGCASLIAGSGIKTLVHTSDLAYKEWPKCQALLAAVGISVISLANSNQSRDSGGTLGSGTESAVALAGSADDRTPLAWGNYPWKAVGSYASLGIDDHCDD